MALRHWLVLGDVVFVRRLDVPGWRLYTIPPLCPRSNADDGGTVMRMCLRVGLRLLLLSLGVQVAVGATVADAPTGRILVKFRASVPDYKSRIQSATADPVRALAYRVGVSMTASRAIAPALNLHVMKLFAVPAADTQAEILAHLRADPAVEYAEPDRRRFPQAMPADTDYANQWYLQPPNTSLTQLSAIDAQTAWDTTVGSKGVVIAQLDTGVLFDHPDLLRAQDAQDMGRLLPGYDFVGDDGGTFTFYGANDGDGWDPDPSDPGDWVNSDDQTQHPSVFDPSNCPVTNSSWHGTRTAGIMAAIANNNTGISGVTWNTWLLPVRVLGKCGGYDSDIITGMLWAAGIHVSGVPDNPFPARIENMSLGAGGACTSSYTTTIDTLLAKGVLVVVSAGNEGGPVDTPANCAGVAAIGGLRQAGTKVGFSNLGPQLAVSAPAGNCGQNSINGGPCLYSLETTLNLGTTVPTADAYSDQLSNTNLGTSFSAPIVSGIAALMLSVNGNVTAPQLIARLKEGAAPFPQTSVDTVGTQPPVCHVPVNANDIQNFECICSLDGQTCGAGMANARGAVNAALRPIAAVVLPVTVSPGQPVMFDASGSAAACHHQIVSYAWTGGGSNSTATFNAPASGSTAIQLTVTDDQSLTDTVDIQLTPNSASATSASTGAEPPSTAGSTACLADVDVTTPVATASLQASSTSVAVGTSFQLSWSSTNASSLCRASGGASNDGWQGNRSSSGSMSISEPTLGTYTYTLTCYGATVSAQSQQSVTVTEQSVAVTKHSGGGSMGWSELLIICLLGKWRYLRASLGDERPEYIRRSNSMTR